VVYVTLRTSARCKCSYTIRVRSHSVSPGSCGEQCLRAREPRKEIAYRSCGRGGRGCELNDTRDRASISCTATRLGGATDMSSASGCGSVSREPRAIARFDGGTNASGMP
jgi:hypothetical protein